MMIDARHHEQSPMRIGGSQLLNRRDRRHQILIAVNEEHADTTGQACQIDGNVVAVHHLPQRSG